MGNLMWCIGLGAWGFTIAGVAAMPKLVDKYPAATNKIALIIIGTVSCTVSVAQLVVSLTLKISVDDQVADLSALTIFSSVYLVAFVVAGFMHREPTTGDSLLMN